MKRTMIAAIAGLLISASALSSWQPQTGKTDTTPMNAIAERYVKTVLALGQHDTDYVDAYYGPPEWKRDAEATKVSLDAIAAQGARRARRPLEAAARERRAQPPAPSIPRPAARLDSTRVSGSSRARSCRSTKSRRRSTTRSPQPTRRRTFSSFSTSSSKRFPGQGTLAAALRRVATRRSSSRARSSTPSFRPRSRPAATAR